MSITPEVALSIHEHASEVAEVRMIVRKYFEAYDLDAEQGGDDNDSLYARPWRIEGEIDLTHFATCIVNRFIHQRGGQ